MRYSKPGGIDKRWTTVQDVFNDPGTGDICIEAWCHKKDTERVFGETRAEVLEPIREAIDLHLEDLAAQDLPIQAASYDGEHVEVTAA